MAFGDRSGSWGKVRGAVVWRLLRAALDDLAGSGQAPLTVVDAGGGTGGFAVPLAALGHRVTVVDPSPDSLAALERRARERGVADAVRAVQGDLATLCDLVAAGSADLVLCHSVLEVVDEPVAAVRAVAAALRPGGLASLLVANRAAAVIGRALAGRFDEARALLVGARSDEPAAGDPGGRRFDRAALDELVTAGGLAMQAIHGIRVFSDLVPGALLDADQAATDALVELEWAASERQPYADVAGQLHVLARR